MMKRAQAAMEFLMTYGWAILVVLAAIAALAFFGILSPAKFLPETCTGSSGLDCLEKASIDASADTLAFTLKNNLGYDINLTGFIDGNAAESSSCDSISGVNVSVDGGSQKTLVGTGAVEVRVNHGQKMTFLVSCGDDFNTGRVSADYSVNYESLQTFQPHRTPVSIRGSG